MFVFSTDRTHSSDPDSRLTTTRSQVRLPRLCGVSPVSPKHVQQAHPPQKRSESRTWSDTSGKHDLENSSLVAQESQPHFSKNKLQTRNHRANVHTQHESVRLRVRFSLNTQTQTVNRSSESSQGKRGFLNFIQEFSTIYPNLQLKSNGCFLI